MNEPLINTDGICNFCTMMDKGYLIKGLSFYESLKEHTPLFKLWVCCMDDTAYSVLSRLKLDNVTLIQLRDFEDSDMLKLKRERKMNEYCWTIKSYFLLFILENWREIGHIIYADADLFFFSDTGKLRKYLEESSVFICQQRNDNAQETKCGIYNAGLIGFRNNSVAKACLEWWKGRCTEWCFDHFEGSKWGDQKYLDQWIDLFQDVMAVKERCITAAPWNIAQHHQGLGKVKDKVQIEGVPLTVFHFHGMHIYNENEFDMCERFLLKPKIVEFIYYPYICSLEKSICILKKAYYGSVKDFFSHRKTYIKEKNYINKRMLRNYKK